MFLMCCVIFSSILPLNSYLICVEGELKLVDIIKLSLGESSSKLFRVMSFFFFFPLLHLRLSSPLFLLSVFPLASPMLCSHPCCLLHTRELAN